MSEMEAGSIRSVVDVDVTGIMIRDVICGSSGRVNSTERLGRWAQDN